MKKFILILAFVVVLSVSLIAHFPAALVTSYVPIPKNVKIKQVSGTIWNGKISNVIAHNNNIGEVEWELSVFRLLTGKIVAQVKLGRNSPLDIRATGELGVGFSGLFAKNMLVTIPAKELNQFINTPYPINISGRIDVTLLTWEYGSGICQSGDGNFTWQDSTLDIPTMPVHLGKILGKITCENQEIKITGTQMSDQLRSTFKVDVLPNEYDASAVLTPLRLSDNLVSQLGLFSTKNQKGDYELSYTGKW